MQPAQTPLLPPTHIIDAPGLYVSPNDPAWDLARCEAEFAVLKARGAEAGRANYLGCSGKPEADLSNVELAELDSAVEAAARAETSRHPVLRFVAGFTRFQLDSEDWTPDGKSCRARDYLRDGATPATFLLIRPGRRKLREVEAIDDTWERREAWVRAVVRRIDGPAEVMTWAPKIDSDEVPEAVLEAMYRWSPALVRQVADACAAYCAPLREHEGKR